MTASDELKKSLDEKLDPVLDFVRGWRAGIFLPVLDPEASTYFQDGYSMSKHALLKGLNEYWGKTKDEEMDESDALNLLIKAANE